MALQLRKILPYALAGWIPGGRRHCALCGHHVWRFMPYRNGSRGVAPLMHALDVVGSDVDHFECPRCGAHDRERHLILYMDRLGLLEAARDSRILHFAAERHLSRILRSRHPRGYVACDLHPASADIRKVDICKMDLPDCSVDMLIANHVLEHVSDVEAAISEIGRILDHNGIAILQTPYSPVIESTWEDKGIQSPEARLQAYGQEDHVRLFGRDIFERFSASILEADIRTHQETLSDIDPIKFGVNADEPFFLFRKRKVEKL